MNFIDDGQGSARDGCFMIFFASDDSGARRYIQSFMEYYPNFENLIFCGHNYPEFFDDEQLKRFNLILTGAAFGANTIDKQLWRKAKALGLKSTAFIEHWSWYAERFIEGGIWITPDEILVNDNLAFSEAVSAGLPQERLITIGNPHLEKIVNSSRIYKTNGTGLRDALAISGNTEVVLFLSEQLQMDFGHAKVSALGYTEYEALSIILETLQPNQKLYIKLHPSEKPDKYLEFIPEDQVIGRCELEDLLGFADHVVGMATMLLIELSLLGERVISLRPNSKKIICR